MQVDRYLIYELKDKTVEAEVPKYLGGYKIAGKITRVYRDVVGAKIELTVSGMLYRLREPGSIIRTDDGNICFLYGKVGYEQEDDNRLWEAVKEASASRGFIDQVLHDGEPELLRRIVFKI